VAAVDLDIADAVTTALKAGTFSQSISPVRSYAEWDDALEDLDELHCDVVPLQTGPVTVLQERGGVEYMCQIDIGLRKRFGTSDQETQTGRVDIEEIDGLKLLLQEIAEFFMTDRLTDTNLATWQETNIQQSWSRPHLKNFRQYFGFVRLTFLADKAL